MKKTLLIGLVCILAMSGPAWATKYGVFAGMNKYLSSYIPSSNWLNGCVPDANHVYTNTIQRGEWTAATVTRLLDSAGTKAAIRRGITNCAALAVSGDTFLYYHSSHGGNNDEPYGKSVYLCAYDNNYPDTELATDLAKFATGVKVVVMVDACHSGGLFQSSLKGKRVLAAAAAGSFDLAGSVTKIMEADRAAKLARGAKGVEKLIAASEIGWITAANYDQYSWDGDTGGLFTDKVIEGWTNAPASSCDLNGDRYANFYELFDYSWDVANNSEYEYTTAMAANTSVLVGAIAGWIGSSAPGGVVTFSNLVAQTVTVGQTLVYPVGAYTSGTNVPAPVTMTTVQAGASYGSGRLTFTPTADGAYTFHFTATNTLGGSASASLAVTATLAAPTLSAATSIGNDRFTANWSAVSGASNYLLDVATALSFSAGGSGATGTIVSNINTGLSTGWEYVNGASNAGAYHKLIGTGAPGVVSPAFSTVSYTNATAGFSVATYGGSSANALTISYSLNGGSSWTAIGTNTGATASSPYVSGSVVLPAAALGQASVRIKWHCDVATASVGLRLQNLGVTGAQPAGASTLVLNGQSVAGTTYAVTGLAMNTSYYYRVKAVGNLAGPSSATGTVTTAATDSAPSFSAISGQSATVGVLFTLGVAGYVSGYPVPALSLASSTASGTDYSFSGGTLSFTPSTTGTFAFVFRASNTLGVASATANVAVAESSDLLAPVVRGASGVQATRFNANWLASANATGYRLDVATNSAFRHTMGKRAATLGAGDLVIVTVNADTNGTGKGFDAVPLVDLDAGTVIYFTDNGWSNGTWRASEGTVTYTAPGAITAGTVLSYRSTTANGFTANASFNPSTSGDTILAYQGSSNSPSFLFGVGWNIASPWVATCTGTGNSEIPAGLSVETYTIVSLGSLDNYQYLAANGTTGSKGTLLQWVANAGNWASDNDASFAKFTPDFTVGVVEQYNDFVPGYENLDVGNATTCIVTGLTEGVTYYYRAKAYNATSNSPYSGTTSVVTTASAGTPPTMNAIGAMHVMVRKTLNATVTATRTEDDPILSYACSSAVNASRWTFNTASGAFTFTPTSNEVGAAQFDFTATDKDGASAPVSMDVTVCAPPPVTDFGCPTNGAPPSLGVSETLTNLTYALQYTTNLLEVPPVWVQVDSEAGNGGAVSLQDGTAAGIQRYYRIVIP